jgi:alkanesulfonate monooxygenase SsuD/methylene tetrahydromethanopterin reductase-like flavin-dependent oxidoreductase (luciferase family)
VRFGVFMVLQHPRPWEPGAEQRLIDEALEQAVLTDRLGMDGLWAVEHHFPRGVLALVGPGGVPQRRGGSHAEHPHRARRVPGPAQLQPPARVSERVGMLDLISNGRLELGTGESNSRIELEGFGIDSVNKRLQWTEGRGSSLGHAVRYLARCLRSAVAAPDPAAGNQAVDMASFSGVADSCGHLRQFPYVRERLKAFDEVS